MPGRISARPDSGRRGTVSGMKAALHDDPREFWELAGPLYEADPLRHTVALTVLRRVLTSVPPVEPTPILLTVEDDGATVGAAFSTPPWPLGLSAMPVHAIPTLIAFLQVNDIRLTGASAPRDVADPFVVAWSRATGATAEVSLATRLYRLADLFPPVAAGEFRLATTADLDLLTRWRTAFEFEAVHGSPDSGRNTENALRAALALGNAQGLWFHDDEPVAYAGATFPIGGMSRIGPVYTLPEHRGHGYGSAVTAAAAQWSLDNGATDVLLFTDLANPTSNSIYQKIGFLPKYDAAEYRFT